eukprot:1398261-Prymnesium_polylepis.1
MGDSVGGIVSKAVTHAAILRWIVPRACERRAGVVVMVLRPQVGAIVVRLKVARGTVAHGRGLLLPPGEVVMVCRGSLRLAAGTQREESSQRLLSQLMLCSQHLIVQPQPFVRQRVGPQPKVTRPGQTNPVRLPHQGAAVGVVAKQHNHAGPRLQQSVQLGCNIVGVFGERLDSGDGKTGGLRSVDERKCTASPICIVGVRECHSRVVPESLEQVHHRNGSERVRRNHAKKVRIASAIAQQRTCRCRRDDGDVRCSGNLCSSYGGARAARANDGRYPSSIKSVAREVQSPQQSVSTVAL